MIADPSMLLEIKNLHVNFKVYGGRLRVIDGVNFAMRAGERFLQALHVIDVAGNDLGAQIGKLLRFV